MRTFVTGGMLCDDGDSVARVEEIEGGLETRYAGSRLRLGVNTGSFRRTGWRLHDLPYDYYVLGFGV